MAKKKFYKKRANTKFKKKTKKKYSLDDRLNYYVKVRDNTKSEKKATFADGVVMGGMGMRPLLIGGPLDDIYLKGYTHGKKLLEKTKTVKF